MNITVTTREAAWAEVDKILPPDFDKDIKESELNGHDVYYCTLVNNYTRIDDYGDLISISESIDDENPTYIWIEPDAKAKLAELAKPLQKYLQENHDMMSQVIVEIGHVSVVQRIIGTPLDFED